MKAHLIVIVILGMLIGSSTHLKADPEITCDKVLKACDEALEKADKLLKGKNQVIKLQDEQVKGLKNQVVELQEERDSIFRSPILWFVIGIAIGGISYGAIKR